MTPPKKSPEKMPAAAPVMLAREGEKTRPLPETGIAERIKEARQRPENGLSIEALSRLCKLVDPVGQGIAFQTLAKYEKGIVLPGARELRILSEALNVSTDFLILGRERKGVVDLDMAFTTLQEVIRHRLARNDPLAFLADMYGDRATLIAKAKEPLPRK
jgi:transcriptional regulator with XRE-family HTH domain